MSIDIELPYPKESETTPPVLESPKICPPLIEGSGVLSPTLEGLGVFFNSTSTPAQLKTKKPMKKAI
jgi:hypothetical protein